MKKLQLLIAALLLTGSFAFAQTDVIPYDMKSQTTVEKAINPFYIQLFGGITQFYGDLNPDLYINKEMGVGYGVALGYDFTDMFGLRALAAMGSLKSEKENLVLDGKFTDLQANLTFHPWSVGPYVFSGLGYSMFTADKPAGVDGNALFIPAGIGIGFGLSPKLGLNLEFNRRYTFSDEIDGFDGNKRDNYSTLTVGLTYRF